MDVADLHDRESVQRVWQIRKRNLNALDAGTATRGCKPDHGSEHGEPYHEHCRGRRDADSIPARLGLLPAGPLTAATNSKENPAGLRPPGGYCDTRSGTGHLDPHHVLKDPFQTAEDRELVDLLGNVVQVSSSFSRSRVGFSSSNRAVLNSERAAAFPVSTSAGHYSSGLGVGRVEHEAGVEPACFGFKAQRGCRQPTARVLDQAAGIGPAWAAFRAQLGCQQPTPE